MSRIGLSIVFVMIGVIFGSVACSRSAPGLTRYVDPACQEETTTYEPQTKSCTGGSALASPTIASGLAALRGGETLLIRAGTYPETINNTVPSGASASQYTVVAAYGAEDVILAPSAGCSTTQLAPVYLGTSSGGARYIRLAGLTIDATCGSSDDSVLWMGVRISDYGEQITLDHLTVRNWRGAAGIDLNKPAHHITVRGCHVTEMAGSLSDNQHHGIYFPGAENVAEDNLVDVHTGGYGIHVYSGTGGASRNVIRGNTVRNAKSGGIIVGSGEQNIVERNLVVANPGKGILLGFGTTGVGTQVVNNTVTGGGSCLEVRAETRDAALINNGCWENATNSVTDSGVGTHLSANRSDDPQFVNAGAGDYRLAPGSPWIDAGTAVSGASCHGPCDVGALEAPGSSPSPVPSAFTLSCTPTLTANSYSCVMSTP